jgi:hypothetical protein
MKTLFVLFILALFAAFEYGLIYLVLRMRAKFGQSNFGMDKLLFRKKF